MGAILDCYEAVCDVRLYVCICLKGSVNFGQTLGVFVFFHHTEWVDIVLRILNLEGKRKLHYWLQSNNFFFLSITLTVGLWGVYPEAIDWNIVLRTQISFMASISEVGSRKTLRNGANPVGF